MFVSDFDPNQQVTAYIVQPVLGQFAVLGPVTTGLREYLALCQSREKAERICNALMAAYPNQYPTQHVDVGIYVIGTDSPKDAYTYGPCSLQECFNHPGEPGDYIYRLNSSDCERLFGWKDGEWRLCSK